jgi:cytochrome c5
MLRSNSLKIFLALGCLLVEAACATLPDAAAIIERHSAQSARFDSASGPLSAARSAAIVAELKRKSGDLDILDKQIALEQAISGSPLVIGNKVTLLLDGPATYAAVCAACHTAGIAGAPKTGDKAAWAPRLAQGKDTLYQHAIQGYNGKAGVMPAKGGRADLTDELVQQAVDYMTSL